MRTIRSKLTYANVMATVAVFIALGGTAYAATQLKKNSVGTKQIKNQAVTAAKIKNGAITGAQVQSGSLTGTQINASTLGTVPSATKAATANSATTAGTASALTPPEAWHEVGTSGQPEFLNSWANSTGAIHGETVAFYKDREGVVHLKGDATGGSSAIMFKLPAGFRPPSGSFVRVPVGCLGSGLCEKEASSIAIVGPNFPITADESAIVAPLGAGTVWLDGVTFQAGS